MDSEPIPAPRSSPRPVTARDVLNAISEVRRRGHWPLFQELESSEPDLAEFVLEELSTIHHRLLETGVRPKAVRRFQRRVQTLVLVCVLALRHASEKEAEPPEQP